MLSPFLIILALVLGFFFGKHLFPIFFVVMVFAAIAAIGYRFGGWFGAIALVIIVIAAIIVWIERDISSYDPYKGKS